MPESATSKFSQSKLMESIPEATVVVKEEMSDEHVPAIGVIKEEKTCDADEKVMENIFEATVVIKKEDYSDGAVEKEGRDDVTMDSIPLPPPPPLGFDPMTLFFTQ